LFNSKTALDRVVIIVLDSVGCGAPPDAARYGDEGANTLGNMSVKLRGLTLPHLQGLGLGHLTTILGLPPVARPLAAYGRMREVSAGKDTTTGHWEIAGLCIDESFPTFPNGFPKEMMDRFAREIGRGVLGNKPASGTEILEELGEQHLETGDVIVYTSADSVFQVAAHEEKVPLEELYHICEVARRLCDEVRVARVIARPFVGRKKEGPPSGFKRTYHRRDFSMPPPAPTVLETLCEAGFPVVGIGKIWDIFAGRGVSENLHSEGNADGMERTLEALDRTPRGVIFCNLVDFDMLYGHRRDPAGYYRALQEFDAFVPKLQERLGPRDLCLITADHGNDPTYLGTDHTREYVPLLALGARAAGRDLGTRIGFFDIAQTIVEGFGLPPWPRGRSFLSQVTSS
jgi:phosphopentomutase